MHRTIVVTKVSKLPSTKSRQILKSVSMPPKPYVDEPNGITLKFHWCSATKRSNSMTICDSCAIRWAGRNMRSIAFGIRAWAICSTFTVSFFDWFITRLPIVLFPSFPNSIVSGDWIKRLSFTFGSLLLAPSFSDAFPICQNQFSFIQFNFVNKIRWLERNGTEQTNAKFYKLKTIRIQTFSMTFISHC